MIGGSGPKKTLPLVAGYADMWNATGSPEHLATADAILRAACVAVGRDEREIERTVYLNVVIRDTPAEARRAWAATLETHGPQPGEDGLHAGGPVQAVAEALARYRDVGFAHPVLILRTPWDHATIEALPDLRAALGD
jgi:alkanesulfonate monooxygenase SsuD/methylene tetrahydromethanopterin reductase-like flavin-dependent oxidoreductase (luciferase family)